MTTFELLPKSKDTQNVKFENVRSMVIVGANGSGKSRMGVKIEQMAGVIAHRITAQRALELPDYIQPVPYEQAESNFLYGAFNPSWGPKQQAVVKFTHRWGGDDAPNRMLSDFENVLRLLFAEESKRNRNYARPAMETMPTAKAPKCKLDTLLQIWQTVMPQRVLNISDDKINASTPNGTNYEARKLSDGERVSAYLIAQALCSPANGIVIIDEPEIHLHRAIHGLLCDKIEAARPDCIFIYITHDLDFAATRTSAKKIWLKEFDGTDWIWEEVPKGPAMPDALLFELLGSRRPLLFVEGDETSYDTAIYTSLFPMELVVSRQSCDKVVEATKSMSGLQGLHNLKVRGIVDRDRRGIEEVEALRANGILVADVAEVENLLCLPEALEAVAQQLRVPDVAQAMARTQAMVIAEMAKDTDQQALTRALAEIQFRLTGFGPKVRKSDAAKLETDLQEYLQRINVGTTVRECSKLFQDAITSNDYHAALRLYNCKGVIVFVANSFGIQKEVYCQIVLELIKNEPDGKVAKAMRKAIEGTPTN